MARSSTQSLRTVATPPPAKPRSGGGGASARSGGAGAAKPRSGGGGASARGGGAGAPKPRTGGAKPRAGAAAKPRTGGARPRGRSTAARRAAATAQRRRRLRRVLLLLAAAAFVALVVVPRLPHAVQEIALPLRHEDIIRQQAAEKALDPALIAAVIKTESNFRDGQVSPAGAQGLMQLTPDTARYIARKSGGTLFKVADLGTPQVNIAYGSYYLRYLLGRYEGNETLALAAYNAGEGNVDRWVQRAGRADRSLRPSDIPYPETRAYVQLVENAQQDYRATYPDRLGY